MAEKIQDKYLDKYGPKATRGRKVSTSHSSDGLTGKGGSGGDKALAEWYEGAQLAHLGQGRKGRKVTPAQRDSALMVHSHGSTPGSEEDN